MTHGKDYEWSHISTLPTRSFVCAHCTASVSSNQGFNGWMTIDGHARLSQYIYICHSCGKPNFFDRQGNQSPIIKLKNHFPLM